MKHKLITSVLILFSLATFSLTFFSPTVFARDPEVTPANRNERDTFTVTITYFELLRNTDYWVCPYNDTGACEGNDRLREKFTTNGDGNLIVEVCGGDNDAVEDEVRFASKGECDADNYFDNRCYNVAIFDRTGDAPAFKNANFCVDSWPPNIDVEPNAPTRDTDIIVNFASDSTRRPFSSQGRNDYDLNLYQQGSSAKFRDKQNLDVLGATSYNFGKLPNGTYRLEIKEHESANEIYYNVTIIVADGGGSVDGDNDPLDGDGGGSGACVSADCNPCADGKCKTAIGDIPIELKALASKILQIGIGLAGGIALILIVIGSIRVLVSSGDQQKLNGGREMIIAAVAGLLFLIFSTLILQFIGLNVLKGVPGIGS